MNRRKKETFNRSDIEANLKKELMALEFDFNVKLKEIEAEQQRESDRMKEETKARLQPKKFESSGNDILGGGIGLGAFDPK